ncbi:hypothetical protein [Nocardia panacis]|nr:hypothetical protein [Nocardia panacis]
MALLDVDSFPPSAAAFFRRRARAAGVSVTEQLRRELLGAASRRAPIDSVVEFLLAHRPAFPDPEPDSDATVLARVYRLPTEALTRLYLRATAAAQPITAYLRHELLTVARTPTVEDLLLEFQELPIPVDLAEVRAAIHYARAI